MRHRIAFRKLGRKSSHRRLMLRTLVTQLVKHDMIRTTLPKAKELRRIADRMVGLAKKNDLHARRQALAYMTEPKVVRQMFESFPERFANRKAGFTTFCRIGHRKGDCAEMALIAFLDKPEHKTPGVLAADDIQDTPVTSSTS